MLKTQQKVLSGYALRDAGWNALVKSLGLVNATRFICSMSLVMEITQRLRKGPLKVKASVTFVKG
jgi:hypothetical protein